MFLEKARTPSKTIKGYKLFRTLKKSQGNIYPLFIGKTKPTPIGKWIEAEHIPTKGFAERPGWHTGVLPIAPHLRSTQTEKKVANRVWAEVLIPANINWQEKADSSRTRDIRNEVPVGGYYKFKTNKMQGGAWYIAGAIKVNKILSDEEVAKVLRNAGYSEDEVQRELTNPLDVK